MPETPEQEIQRLQQEIMQRQARINDLMHTPGTSSDRMRRYMHLVSDKEQQHQSSDEPYLQFPEPAKPREPEPGED